MDKIDGWRASYEELWYAARNLYTVGRWTIAENKVPAMRQAKLWEDLRDALGFPPGYFTDIEEKEQEK